MSRRDPWTGEDIAFTIFGVLAVLAFAGLVTSPLWAPVYFAIVVPCVDAEHGQCWSAEHRIESFDGEVICRCVREEAP